MEERALNILDELDVSINPLDMEPCHRVRPLSRKKVIIKMSRWKDADRMWHVKKNLKGMKLESLQVDNTIFINNSLKKRKTLLQKFLVQV